MTRSFKFSSRILVAFLVTLGLAGCDHPVSQAEFDALQTEHEALQADLISWADEVAAWENTTFNVICDIIAKNPPQGDYATQTKNYCPNGGGDGDVPPDPPEFGGGS